MRAACVFLLWVAAVVGSGRGVPVIVNPGFETGSMSGWTSYSGSWSAVTFYQDITPAEGSRFAQFNRSISSPVRTGIYQQVSGASPGTTYRLLVQTNVRWSGPDAVRSSVIRVGIDPWGGTDPASSNVVWSPERGSTLSEQGRWMPMSVSAMARSAAVTVFAELMADSTDGNVAGCVDAFEIAEGVSHAECQYFNAPMIREVYTPGLSDLELVDYDLDGDLDTVVTSRDNCIVLLYRNNGLGAMVYEDQMSTVGRAERVAAADFNADGFPDLAVTTQSAEIRCFLGSGAGFGVGLPTATPLGPTGMSVGYYDSDEYPDISVACWEAGVVAVMLGDGDGTFTLVFERPTSDEPHTLVSGLIDGDAIPDLAALSRGGPVLRTFGGWPSSPYFYPLDTAEPAVAPLGVQLADFDEDGDNDIVLPDRGVAWEMRSRLLLLDGTGAWQLDQNPDTYYLPGGINPEDVAAADFNLDGHVDVAVACALGHSVDVVSGTGDGVIPARYDFPVDILPTRLRVGDVSGDGLPDIVALGGGTEDFAVFRNTAPLAASPQGWLEAGWNLISVPHETEDMAVGVVLDRLVPPNVLDNAVFGYDSGSGYSVYPGGFGGFEVGRGYWLYLSEGGTAVAYGPGTLTTRSVSLSEGWSLVGHPQDNPVLLSACDVRNGMQTKPFDDAVAAGWLDGVVYGYKEGYFTVRSSGGDDASLRSWRGYWVLSNVPGLTLYVPSL